MIFVIILSEDTKGVGKSPDMRISWVYYLFYAIYYHPYGGIIYYNTDGRWAGFIMVFCVSACQDNISYNYIHCIRGDRIECRHIR